jgi:hypothetical protein
MPNREEEKSLIGRYAKMTNLFLKVNKDLFKLKLNPTEILVLA